MPNVGEGKVIVVNPYMKLEVNEPHEHFGEAFNTVNDAVDWANSEIQFWEGKRNNAINIITQSGLPNVEWRGDVFPKLSAFQGAVSADKKTPSEAVASASAVSARDALVEAIAGGEVLINGSIVGDRILSLEKRQPLAFAIALTCTAPNLTFIKVSNRNAQDKPWPVKDVLDGYRTRYPTQLFEVEGQGGALHQRVEELEGLIAKARETDAALSQFAETLRQKIATEKAVEVWKERIQTHSDRIVSAMQWIVLNFLIAAALVIGLLIS